MANTLDLDPEWGPIDLLEEVEEAFAIKIPDAEARDCWTVGDLYDLICAHTPHWAEQGGTCASSATFYRLRRSFAPEEKAAVSSRSPLQPAGMSASRLFKTLGRETGLRLPAVEPTSIGVIGGWMCLVGLLGSLLALFAAAWILGGVGVLVLALGVVLIRADPARLPDGIVTVGDLVRRTVPLNVQKLAHLGASPPDRWSVLVALAAEHCSLPPDRIRPETFLLKKGMDLATGRA